MSSQAQINANRLNSKKTYRPHIPRRQSRLLTQRPGRHPRPFPHHPRRRPRRARCPQAEFLLTSTPPTLISALSSIPSSPPSGPRAASAASKPSSGGPAMTHLRRRLGLSGYNPIRAPRPLLPGRPRPFLRMQRRIDGTNRMYLRILQVLQDLQSAPWTSLQPAMSVFIPTRPLPRRLNTSNGSVPPIASAKNAHT
jgi:hypothetical protein